MKNDKLHQAAAEHRRGNVMKARRPYQSVLRRRPRLASARYGKALLELESGQLDTGVRELQKLLALEPNHFDGLISLGKALARVGKVEAAIDRLSKAIACDAARIEPYLELSNVHLLARDYRRAEKVLRRGLAEIPGAMPLAINLAGVLVAMPRRPSHSCVRRFDRIPKFRSCIFVWATPCARRAKTRPRSRTTSEASSPLRLSIKRKSRKRSKTPTETSGGAIATPQQRRDIVGNEKGQRRTAALSVTQ